MLDKVNGILRRQEEILAELAAPDVANDPGRMTALMKEQAQLLPVAEVCRAYQKAEDALQDSILLLREEEDPEMRDMLSEELETAKSKRKRLNLNFGSFCFRKTRTTAGTRSLRSGPVPEEMRLRCSQRRFIGCMYGTLTGAGGKRR
jgi:hypothetical protein